MSQNNPQSSGQQQQNYLNIPNSHYIDPVGNYSTYNDYLGTYQNQQQQQQQISAPASWSSANVSPSQSPSQSNASSPYPYCDVRRGRPLIADNEEESDKIKQKRSYARSYREKVRAEKSKVMDENKQLRSIIQRTFYLYTLPSSAIESEIQKIKEEFNSIGNSGSVSPVQCLAAPSLPQSYHQYNNYCRFENNSNNLM